MLRSTLALLWIVAAVGCGGGDGKSAPATGALHILTQTLDRGNVGHSYLLQLQASGASAPYAWTVSASGDPLPGGLQLRSDGLLVGTPTEAAARTVVLVVESADSAVDLTSLFVEVRDVEVGGDVQEVLLPGAQVSLSATGGGGGYVYSLTTNQSGAQLAGFTYTAGAGSGVDVVRATDRDGFYDELAISVGDDPFVGFSALWSESDVWWVNWDVVYDPAPTYATDLDEALASLGLRRPESTDVVGTEADELARWLFLRRSLGHLAGYYGNGMDGNPKPGGLAISFVRPQGPSSGVLPGVGGVLGAAPGRYNSICVRHGPESGVVGTAWLDDNNTSVEHDCGDPSAISLGVFPNRLLGPYLSGFRNSIADDPVGPADVDGLRAMLYGADPVGARQLAIFEVADGFGRVVAAVLAHEIGHSLGLPHSSPSGGTGDLMNTSLSVGPSVVYAFNQEHWNRLLVNLPGPNR